LDCFDYLVKSSKRPLVAVLLLSVLTLSATGTPIARWTFESPPADLSNSSTIGGIAADTGAGTASGVHASARTDWTTPTGNGSANSLSANEWGIGDYFQFQLSTVGYSGLLVSFDQTSSGTGPRDFKISYSVNGSAFTDFASYSVLVNGASPNPSWNSSTASAAYSFTFNLTGVSALNNASSVAFRLVNTSTTSANGSAIGSSGTSRIDNFAVQGTAVPEPGPGMLGLGSVLALLFLARRAGGTRVLRVS
jgi:hypothetical protein